MDFLKKVLIIILTPYQSWIKFQEQRQTEKSAKAHSIQLDIAIDEIIYLLERDATPENKDRVLRAMKKIYKLSRLLDKEYPYCSRKMQKRLYVTLCENRTFLKLYQSI